MKKIPSLFERDWNGDRSRVLNKVTPGCEWVMEGHGVPTRKWDGTCCKVEAGLLHKRYDAKQGKTPPEGFVPAQEPDPITGHWPGWLPVRDVPEDRWFREAWNSLKSGTLKDGTYELVGPKINGNPEGYDQHTLILHGWQPFYRFPTPPTFETVRDFLEANVIEGIVWHNLDGRMAKAKRIDFGFPWGSRK